MYVLTYTDKWSSPEVAGHTPPPCSSFTLTKMGEKRAAMFGGWTGSISLRDLFILDLILNLERHSVHVVSACNLHHYVLVKAPLRVHYAI